MQERKLMMQEHRLVTQEHGLLVQEHRLVTQEHGLLVQEHRFQVGELLANCIDFESYKLSISEYENGRLQYVCHS